MYDDFFFGGVGQASTMGVISTSTSPLPILLTTVAIISPAYGGIIKGKNPNPAMPVAVRM